MMGSRVKKCVVCNEKPRAEGDYAMCTQCYRLWSSIRGQDIPWICARARRFERARQRGK